MLFIVSVVTVFCALELKTFQWINLVIRLVSLLIHLILIVFSHKHLKLIVHLHGPLLSTIIWLVLVFSAIDIEQSQWFY